MGPVLLFVILRSREKDEKENVLNFFRSFSCLSNSALVGEDRKTEDEGKKSLINKLFFFFWLLLRNTFLYFKSFSFSRGGCTDNKKFLSSFSYSYRTCFCFSFTHFPKGSNSPQELVFFFSWTFWANEKRFLFISKSVSGFKQTQKIICPKIIMKTNML